jgi:signal transduction histidine kinase
MAVISGDHVLARRAPYPEPMRSALRGLLAPPYGLWEWGPAVLLLGWSILDIATSEAVVGSRALLFAGALVGSAALVARRRAPLLVLCAVGVAVLGPSAAGAHAQSAPLVLLLVVSVFSCARYGRRPWSYAGLPLGVLFALIGSAADPRETLATSWSWSLNIIWIFGIGLWLNEADRRVEATHRRAESDARAAAAEERLRVARDLHDVLGHSLSTMVVQAEVADELLDRDPKRTREAIRHIQGTGRAALHDTRGVLGLLREGSKAAGLSQLNDLVSLFRRAGLPVVLECDADAVLPAEADTAAYRLVQEALTNALRHSGGAETLVLVEERGGAVRVRVQNAPPGQRLPVPLSTAMLLPPDPRREAAPTGGHGLVGMRERVAACGGTLTAGPLASGGFAVDAVLPTRGPLP